LLFSATITTTAAISVGLGPVNISDLVNADLTTYAGGGNYPQHGGPLTVADIPFMLATIGQNADTAIIQSPETSGMVTFSIPISLVGITSAYTLINTAFGVCGTTVGELDFVGSSNTFAYTLTEGINVRDHFNGTNCNTVTNVAGTASFGNGADRLDMQEISLPASFATDTLERIDFKSFGQGGWPFLAAVTLQPTSILVNRSWDQSHHQWKLRNAGGAVRRVSELWQRLDLYNRVDGRRCGWWSLYR
jgi:hypothetical protein